MADFVGKKVLATRISKATGLAREDVEKVLDGLAPAVARSLAEGKETRIPGLVRLMPGTRGPSGKERAPASAAVDPALLEALGEPVEGAEDGGRPAPSRGPAAPAPPPASAAARATLDEEATLPVVEPLPSSPPDRERPTPAEGVPDDSQDFLDTEEIRKASDTAIPEGAGSAAAAEEPGEVAPAPSRAAPPPEEAPAAADSAAPGPGAPTSVDADRPAVVAFLDPQTLKDCRDVLREIEETGACRVCFTSSGPEAGAVLMRFPAGILLVGPQVSQREYHGLAAAIKMHPERCNGHIVRFVPAGTNPYSEDRMTIIPDEVIESPVNAASLRETLRSELEQAEAEGEEYLRQLAIRIPSREEMSEQVVEVIDKISEFTRLGDRKRAELMPAIREAVGTAIRVGNESDPSRFVDISCLVDREKFAVVIKHEGRGAPATPGGAEAGFSSMIMKKGADEVEHLPPGNRVMLTKYF